VHENPGNPLGTGGLVLQTYRALVEQMWTARGSVRPNAIRRVLAERNPIFADHGQHDATELLITLLDALHEDLNQSPVAQGESVALENCRGMERHRLCNQSKICELFHGESKTTWDFDCGHHEEDVDPLASWPLPLLQSSETELRIEHCMKRWQRGEYMKGDNGMWCEQCGCDENVQFRSKVVRFAPVIIIQLKRFTQKGSRLVKNTTQVSYPLELNTDQWALQGTGVYDLTGVIHHRGSLDFGHYTACVRDPNNPGQWYDISDSHVRPVPPSGSKRMNDSSSMTLLYQMRVLDEVGGKGRDPL
jgi:ubiquitin C-terminal hydrolase